MRTRRTTHTRRLFGAIMAALVMAVTMGVGGVAAEPPTDDPALAADYGAAWLAEQVQPDGAVIGGFDELGDAGSAALALAAAGHGGEAFDRALDHVRAEIETFVAPFGTDDPGRLGRAIMLAVVAGEDPTSFGGTNLVARLQATLGLFEAGLYGAADPSFDGVFRQGLAIVGLVAAGVAPDASAFQWLVDQQCDGTDPGAEGGWMSYRPDLGVPCPTPDGELFVGPDSNSTAMAVMAASAAGLGLNENPVPFIRGTQDVGGGWAFYFGGTVDPNSTGLMIQALVAAGEPPGAVAYDSLLSWQQGCDAAEDDRGAFSSPFADPPGTPDLFSNLDAIPAAAGVAWPIDGEAVPADGAPVVDCSPDGPDGPDGPDDGNAVTGTVNPAAVPAAAPAGAVATNPSVTG